MVRRLKRPEYKSLRLQKRIKHPVKIPSVYRLTKTASSTLWTNKKVFIGITLVYGVLNLLLVQGIAGSNDASSIKASFDEAFNGSLGSLVSGFGVFAFMVGSAGNANSQTAGAYQLFLAIIGSLAMIWALRQLLSGKKIRIRDAFYKGMYPLIPYILVLLVVGLQLIPLLVGSTLYALVINNGIAVLPIERILWALLYFLLALLSFYMLASSIFATYIVTLPDMTPLNALRSARELVKHRRWTVLRKIISLPVILIAVAALVMLPIIMLATFLAQWVFFILTMSALIAAHAYLYTLYRELLNE